LFEIRQPNHERWTRWRRCAPPRKPLRFSDDAYRAAVNVPGQLARKIPGPLTHRAGPTSPTACSAPGAQRRLRPQRPWF